MRRYLTLSLLVVSLPCFAFDHSHSLFDKLLSIVIVERGPATVVDYEYLHNNPEALNNYLAQLEAVSKQDFEHWNELQQLAFLINTYNAFTLKLILNHYPGIGSIRDLGGLIFSSPWKKKFFTLFGKKTHLAHIENDLIRKNYKEPRIHFAINCASIGCPALQKQAYIATRLDQQFEKSTIQFMRDTTRNRFNKEQKLLEISSIFNWFSSDFTRSGSLQNFIAPYISDDPKIQILLKDGAAGSSNATGIQKTLRDNAINIIYLDYDWSLNKL